MDLLIFNHPLFGGLTATSNSENIAMFNLADVCSTLNLDNSCLVNKTIDHERVECYLSPTIDGPDLMQYITETDLFKCLIISRKKKDYVIQFIEWIFDDVLPVIRTKSKPCNHSQIGMNCQVIDFQD